MIVDVFTDHAQRREWRTALAQKDPELRKLYDINKLRVNYLHSIPSIIGALQIGFLDEEEIRTFITTKKQIVQDYLEARENTTTPEFVIKLDELCLEIVKEMLKLLKERLASTDTVNN